MSRPLALLLVTAAIVLTLLAALLVDRGPSTEVRVADRPADSNRHDRDAVGEFERDGVDGRDGRTALEPPVDGASVASADAREGRHAARGGPIRGVVVDSAGAPLAGVRVLAEIDHWAGRDDWSGERDAGREVDSAVTDEAGAFVLDPGGAHLVNVSALSADRPTRRVEGCAPGTRLRIVLAVGASIEGLVTVAGDGTPVVDAVVRVHHGGDQDELLTVTTDAAGRYRADGLLPGEGGVLVVPRQHAMGRWAGFDLEAGGTQRVDVEVEDGWALAGRVSDAVTGDAIAGARVSPWSFLGKVFTTDERGHYRVEGAGSRPGTLSVDAPGYGRSEIRFDGPREDLDIALARAMTVTGRIVDDDGAPLADAVVLIAALKNEGRLARREWSTTRTPDTGRFELPGVRSDIAVSLQARAPGFGAASLVVPRAEAGGVVDVGDLRLRAQAVLAGTVLASDGTPAAGAAISLSGPREAEFPDEVSFHFGRVSATASDEGEFFLPGLGAGTWRVAAHLPAGRAVLLEIPLAAGEQRLDVVLQLPGGTPVSGRVVDAEGRGVPRAFVMLFPESRQVGPPLADECDDAGQFEIEDVPEGPFMARVTGPDPDEGDSTAPLYVPTVVQGLNADGSLQVLELDRLDATVTGQVVDSTGRPVPDAYVCIALDGFDLPWNGVLSDASGGFELPIRAAKPTVLIAWRTTGLTDSKTPTGVEWQLGRDLVDEDGPAGRVTVEAGATSAKILLE